MTITTFTQNLGDFLYQTGEDMKQRYGYTRGAVQTATEITDKFCTRYLHAYHDNKTPFEHPKTCYVYFEADAWEKLLALADNSYEFGSCWF